jgi:hypothetical protein
MSDRIFFVIGKSCQEVSWRQEGGLILYGGEGERRPATGGTRMDYKTGENCSIFVVYRKTGLARFLIKPKSIYCSKWFLLVLKTDRFPIF